MSFTKRLGIRASRKQFLAQNNLCPEDFHISKKRLFDSTDVTLQMESPLGDIQYGENLLSRIVELRKLLVQSAAVDKYLYFLSLLSQFTI